MKNKGTYTDFREALYQRESGGDYHCVNKYGYLGIAQFGKPRLYDLGYSIGGWHPKGRPRKNYLSQEDFLIARNLQDSLFLSHVGQLKRIFKVRYQKYFGKKILGIEVTLSGLVAGAHLKGPGGVRDFLNGKDNADALGTKITEYIEKFGGYDLDYVPQFELKKNNLSFIPDEEIPEPLPVELPDRLKKLLKQS